MVPMHCTLPGGFVNALRATTGGSGVAVPWPSKEAVTAYGSGSVLTRRTTNWWGGRQPNGDPRNDRAWGYEPLTLARRERG
jgi:hypothetical protein